MYDHITEGIIIRSCTVWYEQGERNSKYFLNLEKRQKSKTQVRKLLSNEVESTNSKDILKEMKIIFTRNLKINLIIQNRSVLTFCRNKSAKTR